MLRVATVAIRCHFHSLIVNKNRWLAQFVCQFWMNKIAESVLSAFHSQAKSNTPQNTKCAKMYFYFFFFSIYLKIIFLSLSVGLGLFCFSVWFFIFVMLLPIFMNSFSVWMHDLDFLSYAYYVNHAHRIIQIDFYYFSSKKNTEKKFRVVSLFSWTTTKYHNMHVTKKINSQSLLLFLP